MVFDMCVVIVLFFLRFVGWNYGYVVLILKFKNLILFDDILL